MSQSNKREKPGEFPFTRGIYPEMYKKRLWTMRQYAGFTSAQETNRRYRYLIDRGVTGLSVAFDLPTQIGYDSDHALAEGEVGKVGVPISTLDNMRTLFTDIPLDQVSTSMTINATAAILLGFYIVLAEERGIPLTKLRGTIQNDILKEYIARGTYIYPPAESMKLVTDVFEFCSTHVPRWNTISISGYHIREAGSTAVQELAFTLANGIAYVQAALNRGLDANVFGRQISFFFNGHNDFFTEIAKFRAARNLWAKIMKNRFKVTDQKALMCRFHTQTGGSTLTAQQIDNNVVRTTIQALSSVLGGTQSLHTNSKDEALALPTNESVKLALRTQQIIAHESGVCNYPDPLAGSYVIEDLTSQLIRDAENIIGEIDEMGGSVSAIESDWIQTEIGRSAYDYQKSVDNKEKIIVGVNSFKEEEDVTFNLHTIDHDIIQKQVQNVVAYKSDRDMDAVKTRLNELKKACKNDENVMPFIIQCIKSQATLGEISDLFRAVFGEHNPE